MAKPKGEINILLLGETGCGKSTWINAIANYLKYDSLTGAESVPLTWLIPTSFVIQTRGADCMKVEIGENANANFEEGQAATQSPQTYTFMYNGMLVRLIDVPGMCDTRGVSKDNENFNLILRGLQTIPELHAICILLPPDASKLTVAFQYCLNQLLTHLHVDAAKNIVFCFTKARATLYRAGQTLSTLKRYLEKFPIYHDNGILLSNKTMYYVDNEAFRFLCAVKQGVQFSEKEKAMCDDSWTKAAEETVRFLDYVLTLEPHLTRATLSMNEARRIILSLTGPLTEIAENIETNMRLLKDDKDQIEQLDASGRNLESKLHIKQLTLVARQASSPRLVCASQSCIELIPLPNSSAKVVNYRQTCRDDRVLKKTKGWKCGLEADVDTTRKVPIHFKFDLSYEKTEERSESCRTCGCAWDVHLFWPYVQELQEITVTDTTAERHLKSIQYRKVQKEDLCAARDRQMAVLQQRHQRITEICAHFGAFMHHNPIVPYNDIFIQNQEVLIKVAEEAAVLDGNLRQKVDDLKRHLDEYNRRLTELERGLRTGVLSITPEDIKNMKEELYSMSSPDCDIASYLRVVEEANDEYYTGEDHFFDTDSNVINQIRRRVL